MTYGAVWAFPYVGAPLIPGDRPRRHLGQRIAEESTGEAVTARQRDHRHVGAMVVLGGRTARGVEVQRVRDGEGRRVGEVPVVNRLVVIEPRQDVQWQAVRLRRVRSDRALGGGSTRRNVDLPRPDGRCEDVRKAGCGGRAARTLAASRLGCRRSRRGPSPTTIRTSTWRVAPATLVFPKASGEPRASWNPLTGHVEKNGDPPQASTVTPKSRPWPTLAHRPHRETRPRPCSTPCPATHTVDPSYPTGNGGVSGTASAPHVSRNPQAMSRSWRHEG